MSPRDESQNQNKICTDHVNSTYDLSIVHTMQALVRNHRETLEYLSKFGTIAERAKANLVFEIAASGGV